MFANELKSILYNAMFEMNSFDFDFIVDQASYMNNEERVIFLDIIKRLVGMVQ